jgi:hypothetical protein
MKYIFFNNSISITILPMSLVVKSKVFKFKNSRELLKVIKDLKELNVNFTCKKYDDSSKEHLRTIKYIVIKDHINKVDGLLLNYKLSNKIKGGYQ